MLSEYQYNLLTNNGTDGQAVIFLEILMNISRLRDDLEEYENEEHF